MAQDYSGVSGTIPPIKEDSYFPIDIRALRIDQATNFDLYIMSGKTGEAVLYRAGDIPFHEETRGRLLDSGITHLLVPRAQHEEYLQYLDTYLSVIINDPDVPDDQKSRLLYDSAEYLVKGLMEEERVGELITKTAPMTQHYIHMLQHSDKALPQLIKVMSFDYYTYTHSVNVFTFSISLALEAGFKAEEVTRFGQGVLVHDIGKRLVGAEILNHRGKLSPEQWAVMRKHPEFGIQILEAEGVNDPIMIDATRHHHEKIKGNGYPDGLLGDQVSPWARICAIADIFDALTTRRAYKQAISSFESLALMNREMAGELDPDLLRTFIRMMGSLQ